MASRFVRVIVFRGNIWDGELSTGEYFISASFPAFYTLRSVEDCGTIK